MKILGYLCASLASLFLAGAGYGSWFFRDGMGPDSIESSGSLAWLRFWQDFRLTLLLGVPILLFGLWCIFRRQRVTHEHTNA